MRAQGHRHASSPAATPTADGRPRWPRPSIPDLADGLLLLSYPLHPPNKPEQMRTAFFRELRTPALFVHGTQDPFGTIEELRVAHCR